MKKVFLVLVLQLLVIGASAYDFEKDGLYYNITSLQNLTADVTSGDIQYSGSISIPDSVFYANKFFKVTGIAERGFAGSKITSIHIPSTVKEFKKGAFSGCKLLEKLSIPGSVVSFEREVLQGCSRLSDVIIEDSENSLFLDMVASYSNGYSPFRDCNLTSIYIGRTIKSVSYAPQGLFYNQKNLIDVTFGSNVTNIFYRTFQECSGLEHIEIPGNVKSIQSYAFEECSKLHDIALREGVSTIEQGAFKNCLAINVLCFPNSTESIQSEAFVNCTNISKIYVKGTTPPELSDNAFPGITYLTATLYVPIGTKTIYQNASGWSDFVSVVETNNFDVSYTLTYIVDHEIYKTYELKEGETIAPEPAPSKEGYTFSGWSDMPSIMPPHDVIVKGTFISDLQISEHKCVDLDLPSGNVWATTNLGGFSELDYGKRYSWTTNDIAKQEWGEGWSLPSKPDFQELIDCCTWEWKTYDGVDGYLIKGGNGNTIFIPAIYSQQNNEGVWMKHLSYWTSSSGMIDYGDGYYGDGIYSLDATPIEIGFLVVPSWHDCNVRPVSKNAIDRPTYTLEYIVDGTLYKSYQLKAASEIIPEPEPVMEGYAFSGWKNLPESMPAHNVTVTGYFMINSYKLTYMLDNEVYKSMELNYGTEIIPEPVPSKENYIFSGWSDIPPTMPAHDVIVYGSGHEYVDLYLPSGNAWALTNIGSSSEGGGNSSYCLWSDDYDNAKRLWNNQWSTPTRLDFQELFDYCTWTWETYEGYNGYRVTGQNGKSIFLTALGYQEIYQIQKKDTVLLYWTADKFSPYLYGFPYALYADSSTIHVNNYYVNTNIYCPIRPVVHYYIERPTYSLKYVIDGQIYKSYQQKEASLITPEPDPQKEGYTFSGWSEIPARMPAHDVTVTGSFIVNQYMLTYKVDGVTYKTYKLDYNTRIIPEPAPEKEGYSFSGWSEIPESMPAHDVTVNGSFTINRYKLTYMIDNQVYKTFDVEYGATITQEPAPTKEGYTFSGWSGVPERMPAHDVTVIGTFTVNKYILMYILDAKEYKTLEVDYGTAITPEPDPVKEGYTFSGWSEIPKTMPARTVIITGTFTINSYRLTYLLNGEEYKQQMVTYGAPITPEPAIEREGHSFSGWSEIPETMPAHDVTVTGTLTVNRYILTYILDGREYKTLELDYGTTIIPEPDPEKEGYTFSGWAGLPGTMPARFVIVTGTFSINSYTLTYMIDDEVYKQVKYEYGAIITPEPKPEGDYKSFEWVGIPATMPSHDVTVNAVYETGITEILLMVEQGQARVYSPNGKLLNRPQKGLNIIVQADGKVRKVVVK